MSWPLATTAYRPETDRAIDSSALGISLGVCWGDFARQGKMEVKNHGSGEDGGGTASG